MPMSLLVDALKQLEAKEVIVLPEPAALVDSFGGGGASADFTDFADFEARATDSVGPVSKLFPDQADRDATEEILPKILSSSAESAKSADKKFPDGEPAKPWKDPLAAVAVGREYGKLCNRLVSNLRHRLPAVVLFAPAEAGAAGDTWLLPLGVAFAQAHSGRVLIVEAASNESHWPMTVGIEFGVGLVDVLKSKADWHDAVRQTPVPRIDLLARGIGNWPVDSTAADRMHSLWPELKLNYTLVMVVAAEGSGPLAAVLAAVCDAAVLVIELGKTPRSAAARTKRTLESRGGRVVGCVVRGEGRGARGEGFQV
jgi:Mrp family chromosome partitioning ATPase